jgi:ABC-type multidrug transport system fused ATPase/permease subunit
LTIFRFALHIFRQLPYRLTVIAGMLLATSVTEGLALGFLVPLLELVEGRSGSSTLMRSLDTLLNQVGLQLTVGTALVLFMILFTCQGILTRLKDRIASKTLTDFVSSLRMQLYSSLMEANWKFWLGTKRGDLMNAITLESDRAGLALFRTTQVAAGLVTASAYILVALFVSPPFTLGMVVVAIVVSSVVRRQVGDGANVGREITARNAEFQSVVSEHLDAAKVIKSSGILKVTARQIAAEANGIAEIQLRSLNQGASVRVRFEPLLVGLLCLAIYVAVTTLKMPFSSILVVLFIFIRLFPQLTLLQTQYYELLLVIPGFEKVQATLAAAQQAKESERSEIQKHDRLIASIELRDVQFAYVPGRPVLQGLSFRVNRGENVALVGSSGSGKSTCVDMILGLLEPDSGDVFIDNISLSKCSKESWRALTGYVAQDTVLLNDTIRANVGWGLDGSLSDSAMEDLADAVQLKDFIAGLPEGYDTVIGDRGKSVSGGQRQRIALARALARNPQLLILDEATSALDADTEARIQQMLQTRRDLTVLIVAHRLSTLRNCDRILVLEQGQITEFGTWDEVSAMNGRFSQLRALQAT